MGYRNGITKTYWRLFEETSVGEDNDDTDSDGDSFAKFWGWYIAIVELAKEDITKIPQVVEIPLTAVLNHLSYLHDINQIKERELRKQLNKNSFR